MSMKQKGLEWIKARAHKHLASNVKRYYPCVYTEEPSENGFGITVDIAPRQGKVVEVDSEWVLVKTSRDMLFAAARHLLQTVPEEGATVLITPYTRRLFDGSRMDAPVETSENGIKTLAFRLADTRSYLPVDKKTLRCSHLVNMITQIEDLKAPDGVRRISQVLVDAGASDKPGCFGFKDPTDEDLPFVAPTVQFRVSTAKFTGLLNVIFDVAIDLYKVQLVEPNTATVVQELVNIDFTSLGQAIVNLIDDGTWRIAKVEVIRQAPKRRKAAELPLAA